MATTKTPTTVKNEIRTAFFAEMCALFAEKYGEVVKIGDSEVAIRVGTAPTGEPVWATLSPTVKDYCVRQTKTKTVKPFDPVSAGFAYAEKVQNREIKAEEAAKAKAEKIARDKALREKRKAEREAKKAEGKGE